MAVKKRGSRYTGVVWVPDPTKPSGKAQKRITRRTKTEVESEIRRIKIATEEGTYSQLSKKSVAEYFPEALERHISTSKVKPQTAIDYRTWLNNHILPRIGHLPIQKLDSYFLENFLIEVQASGSKEGKAFSQSSIKKISLTLEICLNVAVRHKQLKTNPMNDVRTPRGHKKEVRALTIEQLEKVEEYLVNNKVRLAPLIRLYRDTGARKGELLALRWSDIDFENNSISISKTAYFRAGTRYENSPKSKNGVRTIELTPSQFQHLRNWRKRQNEERLRAGTFWEEGDFVFTDTKGGCLSGGYPYALWVKICRLAGVERFELHSLRHTHITTLLRAGVPAYIVAKRVGDDPTTILKNYAHILPQDDQRSAITFEKAITSGGK